MQIINIRQMVLTVVSIIFNDSASQFNKDLTDFLRRNTEVAIRKGQLSFNYRIAYAADLPELRSQGIRRLPAMIIGKEPPVIGVPNIIEAIRNRVRTSKSEAAPKTEDEMVREFQISAMGEIKKDADGKFVVQDEQDEDTRTALLANFQKEVERRGQNTQYGDKGDTGNVTEKRLTQAPPPRPTARSKEVERDDTYNNRAPPVVQSHGQRPAYSRPDNLANPEMNDAIAALQRVKKTARSGDDRQDDDMMARLLERMT
jgi:hypothetical protein